MDFAFPPIYSGPVLPDLSSLGLPTSPRIRPGWNVLSVIEERPEDCDDFRLLYGKAEGERRFFREVAPTAVRSVPHNMLLIGGASAILEMMLGNGTNTAGQALTFLNAANANLAVGDGGPTAITGTVSVTNGSTTATFSASQSGLAGQFLQVAGDPAVYLIASGSGTSWTLATAYGGTTGSGLSATRMTAEADGQTDLLASTNKARQGMDATYPQHATGSSGQAITGATNAAPIVVTCTNSYSEGDFVAIQGVKGNTAANGVWRVVSVSGTGFTLEGSAGNGAYTSGGVASKSRVAVFQATFGTGAANHAWNEWGLANASTGGTLFNRKVAGYGTKTSAASWTFKAAIGLLDRS